MREGQQGAYHSTQYLVCRRGVLSLPAKRTLLHYSLFHSEIGSPSLLSWIFYCLRETIQKPLLDICTARFGVQKKQMVLFSPLH